jgi:hypothetical protein
MKLWIAHCIDRHIDPVIRVFDTPDAAIAFAKKFAQEEARGPESIEEEPVQGWLYHVNYSSEGDHVYVTETTLNDAS